MPSSIQATRAEVQRAIEALWQMVEADGDDGRTFDEVERAVWAGLLALGRALVTFFLAKIGEQALTPYVHAGRSFVPGKRRTSLIGTLFGKVPFTRRVGRWTRNRRAAADLPVDRRLGLCSGFSVGVVASVAHLSAQMAFAAARGAFKRMWGWAPSPRAALRMVDALGGMARSFMERVVAPEDDGEVLGVMVDGKGAPSISRRELKRRQRKRRGKKDPNGRRRRRARRNASPRVRRAPGNKGKNKKMAAVGVIFSMRRQPDGSFDGPFNKRVYATFKGYDELFPWLVAEAKKRGWGTTRVERLLFYADGEKAIWRHQKEHFPGAECCIDFFHVIEKLWPAAAAIHGGATSKADRARAQAWFAAQRRRIRSGNVAPVITELTAALADVPATGPGTKHRRKVLTKTIGYLERNRERMPYARMRRLGFDIATGVIEGAVRHLIGLRLDGSGMRWGRERAEAVLHLRCIVINGQWDDFVSHAAGSGELRLLAQPVPAVPYDAASKAA